MTLDNDSRLVSNTSGSLVESYKSLVDSMQVMWATGCGSAVNHEHLSFRAIYITISTNLAVKQFCTQVANGNVSAKATNTVCWYKIQAVDFTPECQERKKKQAAVWLMRQWWRKRLCCLGESAQVSTSLYRSTPLVCSKRNLAFKTPPCCPSEEQQRRQCPSPHCSLSISVS